MVESEAQEVLGRRLEMGVGREERRMAWWWGGREEEDRVMTGLEERILFPPCQSVSTSGFQVLVRVLGERNPNYESTLTYMNTWSLLVTLTPVFVQIVLSTLISKT